MFGYRLVRGDCWRYGQSQEAGYEPSLKKGDLVEIVGTPVAQIGNGLEVVPVRTANDHTELVLVSMLEAIEQA